MRVRFRYVYILQYRITGHLSQYSSYTRCCVLACSLLKLDSTASQFTDLTEKREAKKCADTEPSRAVSDRSTTSARSSLTSLFGWEAVTLEEMAAHADSRLNFDL